MNIRAPLGFSLLEIVVALGILSLLAGLGANAFFSARAKQDLNHATSEITALLREARSRTLASEDGMPFGVFFLADRAILFRGQAYSEGESAEKTVQMPPRIEIAAINLSGNKTVFERLLGNAVPAGDVTVRLRGDAGVSRVVVINADGLVYVE
ncbi:MAG: type II secretion system protein [Parcubacteria group bacterium]|nr:type II secretion system protein [Parcubacteria group bacterium]